MTAIEAVRPQVHERTRAGVLAVALQEAFTGIVRVQTNRQTATDPAIFRDSFKHLFRSAHAQATSAGATNEDAKLAIFAVVVLLDESVLRSTDPVLAGWSRQPLQEELFGGHTGGAVFFDTLRDLLGRPDSPQLADLLEVYGLCLRLGFRGQYGHAGVDEARRWADRAFERVERIRGGGPMLSPEGFLPPDESIPTARDPWIGRLTYVALGFVAAGLLLWLLFHFMFVPSWVSDLRTAR